MKVHELKAVLAAHPGAELRFHLPHGETIPPQAHVTEIARIDKRFIDCGGTLRTERLCRLQTLSGQDLDHRLRAGKLLKIFQKAHVVLESEDLDVDVEHEAGVISQFPLLSVRVEKEVIHCTLGERHTACLAEDKCGMPPSVLNIDFGKLPRFTPTA